MGKKMKFDAIVFPGQGSQRLGMGLDFVEQFPQAAEIFAKASEVLGFDVKEICSNDEAKLNVTAFTQPCILTTEIAMWEAMCAKEPGFAPAYFAGHSLGEYAALVAAGVMSFETAIAIVGRRGALMNDCMEKGVGAMAAIIMDEIPYEALSALLEQYNVDIANDNSAKQVVVSGKSADIDAVVVALENGALEGSVRCVKLNVSAAFHSRYMQPIEETFKETLTSHADQFNVNALPKVASNYLGGFYPADRSVLIDSLTQQLAGTVKWRENMRVIADKSEAIVEVGPNRPLKSFFGTVGVEVKSIMNVKNFDKILMEAEG